MFYATAPNADDPGLFKTTLGAPGGGTKVASISIAWRGMEWYDDGSENGIIYIITWTSGISSLSTVDQNTGALSLVCDISANAYSLAINPLTGIIYITTQAGLGYDFGTLNIETGAFTKLSTLPGMFREYFIAVDNDGICYAIHGNSDEFAVIDLETGDHSVIGTMEIISNNAATQNLSVDRETNELYWASRPSDGGRNFYRIDKTSGALTDLGQCAQEYQAFCIVGSGVRDDAPAPVDNLTVTPDASGALTATISWTNPSLTNAGETLTELTAVKVYENDGTTPIYINSAPVTGENDNYTATVSVPGFYTYTVVAENSVGLGEPSNEMAWVGQDFPAAPVNVQLTANYMTAQLSWTAPSTGLHGGYFTTAELVYDVYRMPGNTLVSGNQTEVTFTETFTQSVVHSYRVVAKNALGTGGEASSNAVSFCLTIASFPWQEGFENSGTKPPVCWEQEYVAGTSNWLVVAANTGTPNNAYEGSYKMRLSGGEAEKGHTTKLVTSKIDLNGTVSPTLKFWHTQRAWSGDQDKFRIYYKNSENGNWNLLEEYLTDVPEWTERNITLPEKSADYYIAFEGVLDHGYGIQLDDISIIDFYGYVDAELLAITAPKMGYNSNLTETEQVKVRIRNNGEDPLTNFQLQLKLNDVSIATETFTSSIPSLDEVEYTFAATLNLLDEGEYFVTVTAVVNGDVVPDNDSKTISVLNLVGEAQNFPFFEDFDEYLTPPTGWTIHNVAGGSTCWSAWYPFAVSGSSICHQPDSPMQEGWLVFPKIKLPNNMGSVLDFWSNNGSSSSNYHTGVWISTTNTDVESFTLVKQLSGSNLSGGWKKLSVYLDDYVGNDVYLAFKYMGDDADAWWIDNVTVKLAGIDGGITGFSGPDAPIAGEPFFYRVTIKNEGNQLLTGYRVKLIDDKNNVLATEEIVPDIAPNTTSHVNVRWVAPTTGVYFLRAVLDIPGDVHPVNDISSVLERNMLPNSNLFEGLIGTQINISPVAPIVFADRHSRSQSVYLAHEILGRAGEIIQLHYFNNFTVEVGYKPIQIWMANTNVASLNTWLPESEFTLVFDGEVFFPIGKETITIPLNIPYEYTGNNLVVMVNRPMDNKIFSGNETFYSTLTPEVGNKTRTYNSPTEEFNWTQQGITYNWHPNTGLSIALDDLGSMIGSVSGTVTDGTNPVEGVRIEFEGTNLNRKTDNAGDYNLNIVLPNTYKIKASKFGYSDVTASVTVTAGNHSTVDLILPPLPKYSVSGKVTGNDAPEGLQDVTLTLTGHSNHKVVTDATGNYSIPDVYGGFTYDIKVERSGYQTYISTIEVNANATHNIELIEGIFPVINPVANLVNNAAVVSWEEPREIISFRYDNDICTGQLGFVEEACPRGVLGACHRANAVLQKMSWYLTNEAGEHTVANIFIFDLDATGKPTTNIIYSARNVPTAVQRWSEYEFPEPVVAPNGFFIAMSHETSFLSIGLARENNQYPFIPDTHFFTSDYEQWEYIPFEEGLVFSNLMLRAEGYVNGKAAKFGYSDAESNTRALSGYAVYRLTEGAPETSWIELSNNITELTYTDNTWNMLASGKYQYAVKAVHPGSIMSEAKLTNVLEKEVGVETHDIATIQLYPNPFTNQIFISRPDLVKSVQVTDILGQNIEHILFDGKTITTGNLSSGVYFIAIETSNGNRLVQKMIKQ